jgi:nitrogenase molybdenum-iron protein alpha/beta subunit
MPELPPDGFTGAILALEGIRDAAVLLNGPTGCKFYHGAISDAQLPRQSSMDPLQFSDEFYFGQPRVPATYLDSQDYIFGATEKLEKILPKVAEKGHRLIAVVNSPGAALIGDDLERFIAEAGLAVPCIAIESTGFSDSFARGYQAAVIKAIARLVSFDGQDGDKIAAGGKPIPGHVNLLGFSIFQRHWEGNADELSRLLGLCGITVDHVICAGCSVADLEAIGRAEANLVVHHEFADELAPYLESRFKRPVLFPSSGAPFGFEETEQWIRAACDALKVDPAPALADIRKAREKAYGTLSRFNTLTGLPRGATFGLKANGSIALALSRWLYSYLGMVPVAITAEDATPACKKALLEFLKAIDCPEAWNADEDQVFPDLAFGGEGFISRFRARGYPVAGIDIALPASGSVEIINRCHMGATGALWLLEQILNGIWELQA